MSSAIDANLLLYASDRSSPFHERALETVTMLAAGPALLYLFWPVAMAYLRIATHPGVFARPLPWRAASENIRGLLERDNVRSPGEDEGFWPLFADTADAAGVRGSLVPDAHLVALMRRSGVTTLWTHDRDFRRFDGITLQDPFAGA
ncbi:MAG TPA: TA system VapC family ribonuclease toxin [Actinomycetota bacterium]|nr:TA system VapC family ribonuclease toxin [Actinomycetota bacterium]